jgi:MFS family permease
VLGMSALEFGLGTAVMTATTVVGSTAGQAIVTRVGFRPVAAAGLILTAVGSMVLSRVSTGGSYWSEIFVALLIFGPGLGAAYVAASIASLSGVVERESGLASALNNVAFQIGGALGIAAVTTVALSQAHGPDPLSKLTAGYQAAFGAAAAFAVIGVVAAAILLAPRGARAWPEPARA